MNWTCLEEPLNAGQWRVEEKNNGYVVIFSGPEAHLRAEEYAAVQNAQARWQERTRFFDEYARLVGRELSFQR
jgi:hypothetical protein